MVAQHYRWDFIGLSTDEKPTPETSEKVVDGSTFYCSDTSKLYVWCDSQWYEKTATGGGGTTYTPGDGITIADNTIAVDLVQETGESTKKVMSQKAISDALASVGGSAIKTLTSADANFPEDNPTAIALWKLEPGIYKKGDNTNIWFCYGSSQSVANSSVITNWQFYQTMFIVGLPAMFSGGPDGTGQTLMAFSGASGTDTATYPCVEWCVYKSTGVNQGNENSTIKYVKANNTVAMSGASAPTASTFPTFLGQIYVDTTNQDAYICTYKAVGANVWKKITP